MISSWNTINAVIMKKLHDSVTCVTVFLSWIVKKLLKKELEPSMQFKENNIIYNINSIHLNNLRVWELKKKKLLENYNDVVYQKRINWLF